jgi:hypothetical protein
VCQPDRSDLVGFAFSKNTLEAQGSTTVASHSQTSTTPRCPQSTWLNKYSNTIRNASLPFHA